MVSEMGVCASCGMPLIPVTQGTAENIDYWIRPFFQDGKLGLVYPKLIYPVFAIGILLSLVFLFSSRSGHSLNIFLSGIILVLSLYGFKNQLYGVRYGLFPNYQSLFTPISFILLLGPLSLFYVRNSLSPAFKWTSRHWLHFIPSVAVFACYTVLLFTPPEFHKRYMSSPFEVSFSHWEQSFAVLLGLGYLMVAHKDFKNWKKDHSAVNHGKTGWLGRFFTGMGLLFVFWGSIIFMNYRLYHMGVATITYNPLWVFMAVFLMWLALEVILQPKFFLIHKSNGISNGKHTLSEDESKEFEGKLKQLFSDQKIYTDPELNLDKLASALDINPRHLSMLLNQVIGKKFYEFVNHYRVEEVKQKLLDPDNRHLTIEAIAKDAGFRSKSTFNATFKKLTKMTPRTFMKR